MSETDNRVLEEIEVRSEPSPSDAQSWFEYSWKLQQCVPERLEDAAKFLAVMISLSLSIISTAQEKIKIIVIHPSLLYIGFLFWLIALFFAFLVLFHRRSRYNSFSVESIKDAHFTIIRGKQVRLFIAVILYLLPFAIMLIVVSLSLFGVIS